MRRFIEGTGYARMRFINGVVFVVLGLAVIAQFVHAVGFRFEALTGYVLGLAFVGLGAFRIRAGWPTKR